MVRERDSHPYADDETRDEGPRPKWPTVSVIVPVSNAAATLDDCLRSLRELRYPADRLELIAVDNDSADGSWDILERHRDRVRLLKESRRGPSSARNRGIRVAEGDILAFTDADCIVHPNWLRHLVHPFRGSGVGIAGGRILARRPCSSLERFGETILDHERALTGLHPPYAIGMNWASPRDLVESLGGFDELLRRAEDSDLSFRIFDAGYRFAYVREAIVFHLNESTLPGLFREGYLHGLGNVRLRQKHREFLERILSSARPDAARARGGRRATTVGDRSYELVYSAGKRIGDLAGSLRYGRT